MWKTIYTYTGTLDFIYDKDDRVKEGFYSNITCSYYLKEDNGTLILYIHKMRLDTGISDSRVRDYDGPKVYINRGSFMTVL